MHNPPGDGNCQFGELCFWLNRLGIHRSPEKVREEIVEYLGNNPTDTEGLPLELYAVPWSQYLQSMATDGTYGNQITLQAAADLYNIEVLVVSTLGYNATTLISPTASIPNARVQLGTLCGAARRTLYLCRRWDFSFGGRATPGRKLRM